MFGDRQEVVALTAGADPAAQTGVAGHLPAVGKPAPVADLALDHFIGQSAQTPGPEGWGGRFQRGGGRIQFDRQRSQQAPEHFQTLV